MNRDHAKSAYDEYINNLIIEHHLTEEEATDYDQFIGMLRGDIPTPVVCDMELEIRERKRIFEQFIRGFEEAGGVD